MKPVIVTIALFIIAYYIIHATISPGDPPRIYYFSAIFFILGGFILGLCFIPFIKFNGTAKERYLNSLKYSFPVILSVFIFGYMITALSTLI